MSTFDVEFEDQILSASLRYDGFLKKSARICESHHFGTKEHAWIWGVISDVWKKHRERASGKLIVHRAKAEFKDETKRKPYLLLARKLVKTKPTHPHAALTELSRFVRHVNLQLALEESAKALDDGKIDEAEKAVSKATRDASASERKYTHIQWIEGFNERQAARKYEAENPDEFKIIPTPFKTLNKALGGGSRSGELNLIMGTTGRGKSVGGTNVAMAAVRAKVPTLYIGTEMPAKQIATRQDARWTEFLYSQFKTYSFKPSELREIRAKMKREARRFENMFHILSFPVRSATIMDIYAALDDLKEEFDFRPECIVMDSGDHLRSTDKSLDSYRLQQADVYWELKRLAEEENYVVWSTVQAGKEFATATATSEATSESYDKARIADMIISFNDPLAGKKGRKVEIVEDEDDEDDEVKGEAIGEGPIKRLDCYLAKYRDGVSKIKFPLDVDFTRIMMREATADEEE